MRIFLIGICLFLSTSLYGASIDEFMNDFTQAIVEKTLNLNPVLTTSDVMVSIKGRDIVEKLGTSVADAQFRLEKIQQIIGTTRVEVGIKFEGESFFEVVPMIIDVDAFSYFYRALRYIKEGEIITRGDFELVYESIKAKPVFSFITDTDILGREASEPIAVSALITKKNVRDILAVRKGDRVTVVVNRDSIEISVPGLARSDGYVGDSISVKVDMGKSKLIKGEVIDGQTVRYIHTY